MPESETSRKITKLVKAADRLVQDTQKNIKKLREAVEELKEKEKKEGDGEEKSL